MLLEFGRYRSFPLSQAHFVERNGVVLIVALGESMVSLSLGLGEQSVSPAMLLAALLSLLLAASLWSLYFLDADEAAQHTLDSAPRETVLRIAGLAYSYAFVPLLAGIVMISSGLTEVLAHPLEHLPTAAPPSSRAVRSSTSSASLLFRQSVSAAGGAVWVLSVAAVAACIGAFWLGTAVTAVAEVAVLAVILFALAITTRRVRAGVDLASAANRAA